MVFNIIFRHVAIQIYKSYYASLWKCLPKQTTKSLQKMKETGISATLITRISKLQSSDLINEAIVGATMSAIKSNFDALMFCGFMEKLVDNFEAKQLINSMREGMCSECSKDFTL